MECLAYIIKESAEVITEFDLSLESSMMKSIRSLLQDILSMFPQTFGIFEQISKIPNLHPAVEFLYKDLAQERIK